MQVGGSVARFESGLLIECAQAGLRLAASQPIQHQDNQSITFTQQANSRLSRKALANGQATPLNRQLWESTG